MFLSKPIEEASLNEFYNAHKLSNKYFHDFLRLYIYYLCSRCQGKGHASAGIINKYLMLEKKRKEKYYDDIHGLFEDLIKSFYIYLINTDDVWVESSEKINSYEKIFSGIIEKKNNDKKTKNMIRILNEHYEEKTMLLKIPEQIGSMKPIIKNFNKYTLPSLKYFFNKKENVFIRHGLENHSKNSYCSESIFPPLKSFKEVMKSSENNYPIEIDTIPFCSTIDAYKLSKWPSDCQNGYCSNHDGLLQWNTIKGYISIDDYKEKKGKICDSKQRDHLFAKSELKIKDWQFVYQSPEEELNFKNAHHKWKNNKCIPSSWEKDRKGFDAMIQINEILKNNIKIISQETVFLFFQLHRMLKSRLILLN